MTEFSEEHYLIINKDVICFGFKRGKKKNTEYLTRNTTSNLISQSNVLPTSYQELVGELA